MILTTTRAYIFGAIAGALLLISVGVFVFAKHPPATYVIEEGVAARVVTVTGTVVASKEAELSFPSGGVVERVRVTEGDAVDVGTVLVALDTDRAAAQVEKARAVYEAERARLTELERGATDTGRAVSVAEAESAQQSTRDAQEQARLAIANTYTVIQDVLKNRLDTLFAFYANGPRLIINIDGVSYAEAIEEGRPPLDDVVRSWRDTLLQVTYPTAANITLAQTYLDVVSAYMDVVVRGMYRAVPSETYPQSIIAAYQESIIAGRSAITSSASELRIAKEKLAEAERQQVVSEKRLESVDAGTREEALRAQQAQVRAAQAALTAEETGLSDMVLRSPLKGTVTGVHVEQGESVGAHTPVVSVISEGAFDIEAYVPELRIAEVAPGNHVQVTLDAYPGVTLSGTVMRIDPAGKKIEGTNVFRVRIALEKTPEQLRRGLTATVSIQTLASKPAPLIPTYLATRGTDGVWRVRVWHNGTEEERTVTLGVAGDDGRAEVLGGLRVGEQIVLPRPQK